MTTEPKNGIDLFCGLGGFSFGMKQAGITPVLGVDSWDVACSAYKSNFPEARVICGDLSDTSLRNQILSEWKGHVFAVVGGPPCQTYSRARDPRVAVCESELALSFSSLAVELDPDLIVMENVPRIEKTNLFKIVLEMFKSHKYTVEHKTLNAADYGVPQNRRRMFVVATKDCKTQNILESVPKVKERVSAGSVLPPVNLSKILSPYQTKQVLKEKTSTWYSAYNVLDETKVSPAVTTQFFSPTSWPVRCRNKKCYRISQEDALALQTFPITTRVTERLTSNYRLIGNAVPPLLSYAILKHLSQHASETPHATECCQPIVRTLLDG